MKLVSLAPGGALGVVRDGRVITARELGPLAPATMSSLLVDWHSGIARLAEGLEHAPADAGAALVDVTLLAPVPRPGKIACAGVNYRAHAAEQQRETPDHPVMFAKFATAVVGDGA